MLNTPLLSLSIYLVILLVLYLLARTMVLAVYRLAKKKQWVGKALARALSWAMLPMCVLAIVGPRSSILTGIGSLFLIAIIVGGVRQGRRSKSSDLELFDEDEGSGFYTGVGDAMSNGASVRVGGGDGPGYYL